MSTLSPEIEDGVATLNLLPKQVEFLTSPATHTGYIGGFGSGKTFVLAVKLLILASQHKNGLFLAGAKTYPLLRDSTRATVLDTVWPMIFGSQKPNINLSENKLTMPSGTVILFRSLDKPSTVTNLNLSYFVIDEASYIKESVFFMLQGRLRNQVGPRKGDIVGNPPPPLHWIDKSFARAAPDSQNYHYINAPTTENYTLPSGYVENMKESYGVTEDSVSLYAKRFIYGQIVAFEGAVWPELNPDAVYVDEEEVSRLLSESENYRFVAGIDFGCANPFCCSWHLIVGNGDQTPHWIVLDMYKVSQVDYKTHADVIRQKTRVLKDKYGLPELEVMWGDHDAQGILELGNYGVSIQRAHKREMRERQRLLVQRLIISSKFHMVNYDYMEEALSEMCQYHFKEREDELNLKEEPVKSYDHFVDSLLMPVGEELYGTFIPKMKRSGISYSKVPDSEQLQADSSSKEGMMQEALGRVESTPWGDF